MQTRCLRRIASLFLLASCAPKHLEPEHVAHSVANEPAKLAYSIDAFVGNWKIEAHFKARPNSPNFDLTGELVVRFAKVGPDVLDVYVERLSFHGTADTKSVEVTMAASDPKFAALMETPVHRIVMRANGPGEATPNLDNPIARQGANLIKSTVFLIPPLPDVHVTNGAKWAANRVVPKSNNAGPEVEVEVHYELVGLERCGKAQCAVLASTADTGEREAQFGGAAARVRYTLEGTSQIQLNGALVKSETKMTMLLESEAVTFDADGTFTCRRI